MNKIVKLIKTLSWSAAAFPILALAQVDTRITPVPRGNNLDIQQGFNWFGTIVNIVFTAFLIFSVLYIILAAFNFLTSGGDKEKITTATKQLVGAAIGIAVALLAVSFKSIVENFINVRV